MKDDEKALYDALVERGLKMTPSAGIIAMSLAIPRRKARYWLMDKWPKKGLYEYGSHWSNGWLVAVHGG